MLFRKHNIDELESSSGKGSNQT